MSYSQKPLAELMKTGKFPGETSQPRHIETVISNVFIFDDKVYKFYKNDNDFFNKSFRDISKKADRFSFTKRDFEWNKKLSPSIHLHLVGVAVKDGAIHVLSPDEDVEELMSVMNRVNSADILFERLISGKVSLEDSFEMGKQLGQSLKKVQKSLPDSNYNFYDLYKTRILDLRNWIKSVTEFISEEESGAYCDFLEDFRNKNKDWFETTLTSEITTDGDFHSHNVIFSDGLLHLIDTFPPKDEWGVGHQLIPLYRIGTDIWALSGNQDLFENFIKGYEEGNEIRVDRKLDDLYIIYASGIAVSYLYVLQRTDPNKKEFAERFHKFVRNYFAKIK